jgi:hypothetical protein
MSKFKEHLEKLESLRQIYMGVKTICNCIALPSSYEVKNREFRYLNVELVKLVLGKIIVLLSDRKPDGCEYNQVSFKILLEDILKDKSLINDVEAGEIEKLEDQQAKIEALVDEKYKNFRDKCYAHIELDEHNDLRKINTYRITENDIKSLLSLAEQTYDAILYVLDNKATSDHMKKDIERLSSNLLECYQKAGLLKNRQSIEE